MNKYQDTINIDYTKGAPYYETVIPTRIQPEVVPFYYTTYINERLDNISSKFYKTPNNWWIIAKANNLANGTLAVPAGTKLFIPNV
jgi:hypothetical protein